MSSLNVATEATSTLPVSSVIDRRALYKKNAVVKVRVPKHTTSHHYEVNGKKFHCLKFAMGVRGGVVYLFVRTKNDWCVGIEIHAEVSVMEKTLADGRKYIYIDLEPVPNSVNVTHRLVIMAEKPIIDERWIVFANAAPLEGTVALAPADAKIIIAK